MSLAFRAYFALPPDLATSAGVVTNAVHGFASMVVNLVRDHRPVGLAVAFDLPGGTFRDEIVDDYKGGRAETPADLPPQFDMIREAVGSLAIPVVGAEGFEADDVLATLATEARDREHPVIIVTGDRDSYQLVEDPYVRVLYNRRGVSDYALYDEAGIEERTGVRPERSTRSWPPCGATRRTTFPGCPGWGRRRRPSWSTSTATSTPSTPTSTPCRPSSARTWPSTRDRVRINAEVIPLSATCPSTSTSTSWPSGAGTRGGPRALRRAGAALGLGPLRPRSWTRAASARRPRGRSATGRQ